MKKTIIGGGLALLTTILIAQKHNNSIIYKSEDYTIFKDKVEQKPFTAQIISAKQISSNYKSPENQITNPLIEFKFSINGKDNELPYGINHKIIADANATYPVFSFGKVSQKELKHVSPSDLKLIPGTKIHLQLDLREVLNAFKNQGFYTTNDGSKIYASDFKGIYIAGGTPPMTWDFDNLVNHKNLELKDPDGDGIYDITLVLNLEKDKKQISPDWKLSKNIADFPQYSSTFPISDAIYNLSIEEMTNLTEADGTLRTGQEWAGVWTRDVSYSIILAMSYLQPDVSKNSLLKKVNKSGLIIQDTGTGGAYPVSSDRMIWAVAAWQLYKTTGDKNWLQQAYQIIKKSIFQDMQNVYDSETGLVKGESSFLDWREQTYPLWMQPADIYESENLGTNAVHYQANIVAAQMANILGELDSAKIFKSNALKIKKAINQYLWISEKGYYGQYLYGREHKILSPRSETLGEALAVIFGILEDENQQKQLIENVPQTQFGNSCIFPQIPGIPPYHNNGVWPFVQSYWMWASAKAGNEKSVTESIAAIYRAAALFATNKENFVAENGDFAGTQVNSSNMLWSIAGNISLVHRILFGITFEENGLTFSPFVPEVLKGERTLTNFKYRNAVLDIQMQGFGNAIKSFLLDGKPSRAFIPETLSGKHSIKIILSDDKFGDSKITKIKNLFSPETPIVKLEENILTWNAVKDAVSYKILKDGKIIAENNNTSFAVEKSENFSEYQIIAVNHLGLESFASEPIKYSVSVKNNSYTFQVEDYAKKSEKDYSGFTGSGFVEISTQQNTVLKIPVEIKDPGKYSISFKYSNGNGPKNTENKCAIRALLLNNNKVGTFVFPQRGSGEWSNWGNSNSLIIDLDSGLQILELKYIPENENMNIEVNQAMLDELNLQKIN